MVSPSLLVRTGKLNQLGTDSTLVRKVKYFFVRKINGYAHVYRYIIQNQMQEI